MARQRMIDHDICARGVRDPRVIEAMRVVPRERFVPPALAAVAYEDRPLSIEAGQTISQPYIVAVMTEALALQPGDRVLEVGTGSGYAAAVLAQLVREVYTVERHAELAALARARLAALGYRNAEVRCGDGTLGWPAHAPFDAIVVAAGGPDVPRALLAQLAIGGRLVMPVGRGGVQALVRVTRVGETAYRREDLGAVQFVPLIGAQGWPEPTTASGGSGGTGLAPRRVMSQAIHPPPQLIAAEDARVADIMTRDPITVHPELSLEQLRGLLLERDLSRAPVVDAHGRLIGMVGKTDLVVDQHQRGDNEVDQRGADEPGSHVHAIEGTVGDIMTPVAFTVHATTSVGDAARRMLRDHLHAVPVADYAGQLVGMVSASDIVAWVAGVRPCPA
ncbi:MAG TPA: protein-L-isoaspartate(D-aspartate) O-methyltransferase [Kofleriaceae bacterium]|nr:protein-L-isoaspartate(D-aspartate) O-methyltransferase [Kofleriaceae bacterium]